MIVALIEFLTAVWLSLYMGWAVHSLRLIPRFTNTLLSCCGKKHQDVYYEDEHEEEHAAKGVDELGGKVSGKLCCRFEFATCGEGEIITTGQLSGRAIAGFAARVCSPVMLLTCQYLSAACC